MKPVLSGIGDSTPIKIPNFVADSAGKYKTNRTLTENQIVNAAKALLKKKFSKGSAIASPGLARDYLMLNYAKHEYEVFICIFLDNQNRVLKLAEMFTGSIGGASVYPREVVKKSLELNAAAIVFAHNHPSGTSNPSQADKEITVKLIKAMNLVDVRVLDHLIVGGGDKPYSFAEHGLI